VIATGDGSGDGDGDCDGEDEGEDWDVAGAFSSHAEATKTNAASAAATGHNPFTI
jgi:hypothetical protein